MSDEPKTPFELAQALLEFARHGDYSSGNEAFGVDEGRVMANEALDLYEKELHEAEQRIYPEVAAMPTKNYKEVIEVRVPTRFYWDEEGAFDGIEFGPFETSLQPWEEDMTNRCLEAVTPAIGKSEKRWTRP